MDGLIDIASARTLVAAPLWPRIRDFLWNFPSQIHPSWFDRLTVGPLDRFLPPPDSRTSGQPAPRLPSRIARWLCTELSVEPCFHDFPSTDLSRLLLLDAATLGSIAAWLGALSTADALRRVTRGPDVAALKSALPDTYPALFAYTAYFAKTLPPTATDTAPSAILALGHTLLFSSLSPLPPPFLHRLLLKLPADAPAPSSSPNDPTIQRSNDPTIHNAIKLLLKLRFPEAHALCFS